MTARGGRLCSGMTRCTRLALQRQRERQKNMVPKVEIDTLAGAASAPEPASGGSTCAAAPVPSTSNGGAGAIRSTGRPCTGAATLRKRTRSGMGQGSAPAAFDVSPMEQGAADVAEAAASSPPPHPAAVSQLALHPQQQQQQHQHQQQHQQRQQEQELDSALVAARAAAAAALAASNAHGTSASVAAPLPPAVLGDEGFADSPSSSDCILKQYFSTRGSHAQVSLALALEAPGPTGADVIDIAISLNPAFSVPQAPDSHSAGPISNSASAPMLQVTHLGARGRDVAVA